RRPYGAPQARVLLTEVRPSAPDVPIQIAHLAGGGGYDDPLADEAMRVWVAAAAAHDARLTHVYFEVSGVAGVGLWARRKDLIVARIRQIGIGTSRSAAEPPCIQS